MPRILGKQNAQQMQIMRGRRKRKRKGDMAKAQATGLRNPENAKKDKY